MVSHWVTQLIRPRFLRESKAFQETKWPQSTSNVLRFHGLSQGLRQLTPQDLKKCRCVGVTTGVRGQTAGDETETYIFRSTIIESRFTRPRSADRTSYPLSDAIRDIDAGSFLGHQISSSFISLNSFGAPYFSANCKESSLSQSEYIDERNDSLFSISEIQLPVVS